MPYDTIEIDGYTVNIEIDDFAENPFDAFDCEPPLLAYNEELLSYNGAPQICDLVSLIPLSYCAANKRALLEEFLGYTLQDFAHEASGWGVSENSTKGFRSAFAETLSNQHDSPRSWSEAERYFDLLESLCKLAGVPCYYGHSNGYSQGDSAWVIAFATPEWVKQVGIAGNTEALRKQCQCAFDLFGAWAWGDVYGVSSIEDPDGNDISDGSCWGFYGRDHEQSGLRDHATGIIAWHKRESAEQAVADAAAEAKELSEREYWAARDLVTC